MLSIFDPILQHTHKRVCLATEEIEWTTGGDCPAQHRSWTSYRWYSLMAVRQ